MLFVTNATSEQSKVRPKGKSVYFVINRIIPELLPALYFTQTNNPIFSLMKAAFKAPAPPTPSPSPVPHVQQVGMLPGPSGLPAAVGSLSEAEKQAQMVTQFAVESGMNESWSRK